MKFEVEFTCDNVASNNDLASEISRILRRLADKLEEGELTVLAGKYRDIKDANGNKLGTWRLK